MTKRTINVGDRVLSCIPWTPGMQITEKKGEGIVTLITDDDERRARVLWATGILEWIPENELVNVKNVK